MLMATPLLADGNWALCVGVGEYEDKEHLPTIEHAARGAYVFAQYLVHAKVVPEDHAIILLSPTEPPRHLPTRKNVLGALEQIGKEGCDTFYFYYSGHGGPAEGVAYYTTYDTKRESLQDSAIPMETLWAEVAARVRPRRAWLFVDSCFAAYGGVKDRRVWEEGKAKEGFKEGSWRGPSAHGGMGLLFSSYDTTSMGGPWEGLGLATWCILRSLGGLQDADVDHDQRLTFSELTLAVEKEVDRESRAAARAPREAGEERLEPQRAWYSTVGEFKVNAESLPLFDVFGLVMKPLQVIEGPVGIKVVVIPPTRSGAFQMGSPVGEEGRGDDETQHEVTLTHGFLLGCTEVTQGQYEAVMGKNPSQTQGKDLPVDNVSWEDAVRFCEELTKRSGNFVFRLPTEAEWEYACRADTRTTFYFGSDERDLEANAWVAWNSERRLQPVGTRKPNAWGLYDMLGNAWEWCADGWGEYPSRAETDPLRYPNSKKRVLRGGCVIHERSKDVRCASRHFADQDWADFYYGFRVAADPLK